MNHEQPHAERRVPQVLLFGIWEFGVESGGKLAKIANGGTLAFRSSR
jgi:hypothetical protein